MSISGDWVYTAGNFKRRPKSLAEKPDRFGKYTTVWNKDANGNWKYLIDIGNTDPSRPLDNMASRLAVEKTRDLSFADNPFLMDLEKKFMLAKMPSSAAYLLKGSKISPGKDLAAIYGTLNHVIGGGNYLRMWGYEKNGWKNCAGIHRVLTSKFNKNPCDFYFRKKYPKLMAKYLL